MAYRRAFTLVEVLVVIAIIGILAGILLPAIHHARETARRAQCLDNFKQIGQALHLFHDRQGRFPEGAVNSVRGVQWSAPRTTFMVHLLPDLGGQSIYDAFDSQVEEASPAYGGTIPFCASINSLPDGPCSVPVPTLLCPSDGVGGEKSVLHNGKGQYLGTFSHSNYLAFFGDKDIGAFFAQPANTRAAFGVEYGARLGTDFRDGVSNTMVMGEYLTGLPHEEAENDMRGVYWFDIPGTGSIYTRAGPNSSIPDVFFPDTWCYSVPGSNLPCIGGARDTATKTTNSTATSRSYHPGGVNVLYGDGSVHFKTNSIDLAVWQELGSVDGNKTVSVSLTRHFAEYEPQTRN